MPNLLSAGGFLDLGDPTVHEACGIAWNNADILRFLQFLVQDPARPGCQIWGGAKSKGQGNHQWYGSFWTQGKTVRAHKFSSVAILGLRPSPGSHHLDHDCDYSLCVSCMQILTPAQNQAKIRRPNKLVLDMAAYLCVTPAEWMDMTPRVPSQSDGPP